MRTLSRRALLGAFSTIPLIAACDQAERLVGGDPLVDPRRVTAGALREAARDARLADFYKARGWRAAWSSGDAGRLQDAFGQVTRHGIEPARFTQLLDGAQEPAAREVALTRGAMALGDALAHGLADPASLFEVFALERNTLDVDQSLNAALAGGDLAAWLASLAPQDAGYQALTEAYLAYRAQAAAPQPEPVPEGRALRPGGRDARVPQLAAILQSAGYYSPPTEAAAGDRYEPALVEAVKRYQDDHGLDADGVVGPNLIAILNAGPDDRARQIALNLEARRWLKREVPGRRIDVNTAAAFLEYFRDEQRVDFRRVVAGKPGDETPHLSGEFTQLVVNPPWNVPEGIAAEEILPKGPGYLAANDMTMVDGRVVQRPGPGSALGLVKFDMQNRYAIYLHDTPAKDRFQANERHFSHGCVRVADAVQFAEALAVEHGKGAEFQRKLASGETSTVELGAETPVRLLYHTAFVDPQGRIGFRPDVYGWDAKLAEALGMTPPMRRGLAGPAPVSIGP